MVEAVIGVELGAAWIPPLRRRAATDGPIKWPTVAAFVMSGTGEEARAARAGLGAQQIIVTDPMHEARRLDLHFAERGLLTTPTSALLFPRREAGVETPTAATQVIRRHLFNTTLRDSGLGTLCDLLAQADSGSQDGDIAGRGIPAAAFLAPIAASLRGSLNKAAKLASKSTALASPLLDPERHRARRRPGGEDLVFAPPQLVHVEAQRALTIVADQRLVVDQGHQDITQLTEQLRDMAEVHSGEPFLDDRAAPFEALRQQRTEGASARGYVRADSDARQLRLQIADVAAGWARTIAREQGYAALVATFRCVVYNGRILMP